MPLPLHRTLHRKRTWWGVVLIFAVVACGTSPTSSPPGSNGTHAEQTVGATGGTAVSSDGMLTVTIPEGALSADTIITVEEISSPIAGSIGVTYEIGPTGTQFKNPVTLSFN